MASTLSVDDLQQLQALLEEDISTLHRLVFTSGQAPTNGDIRAACAILRRWLVEDKLSLLCAALGIRPTLPVFDNAAHIEAVANDPSVTYFATGGVRFGGEPLFCFYHSEADPDEPPPFPESSPDFWR